MRVQTRTKEGSTFEQDILLPLEIVILLEDSNVEKVSWNLIPENYLDKYRLILYPDGTYQILGGLVNYPRLKE